MNFQKDILNNNIFYLKLQGDLIGENNGPALVEEVNNALNKNLVNCIIDIGEIRFINSSGLGVLITLLTKFRNHDGEVVLIKPSEQVSKLLAMTKLNNIFTVFGTKEEGVKFFAK